MGQGIELAKLLGAKDHAALMYANPETYHAVTFWIEMPGKRARNTLAAITGGKK